MHPVVVTMAGKAMPLGFLGFLVLIHCRKTSLCCDRPNYADDGAVLQNSDKGILLTGLANLKLKRFYAPWNHKGAKRSPPQSLLGCILTIHWKNSLLYSN